MLVSRPGLVWILTPKHPPAVWGRTHRQKSQRVQELGAQVLVPPFVTWVVLLPVALSSFRDQSWYLADPTVTVDTSKFLGLFPGKAYFVVLSPARFRQRLHLDSPEFFPEPETLLFLMPTSFSPRSYGSSPSPKITYGFANFPSQCLM